MELFVHDFENDTKRKPQDFLYADDVTLYFRIHVPATKSEFNRSNMADNSHNLRPSAERHLHPNLPQKVVVNFGRSNLRLTASVSELGQNHAPRANDHAVAVAHPPLVVSSGLGGLKRQSINGG